METHPLRVVALRVLEDWGMMLVDPVAACMDLFSSSESFFMATIEIKGALRGTVSIIAQCGFLKSLTNNVLGTDGEREFPEMELLDAFRELGNVLTGNFITEAYGDDTVFDLLNPVASKVSNEEANTFMKRRLVFAFLADENPVAVSFDIQGEG